MNETQRDLWVKAIKASYTITEVDTILKSTELRDYKLSINPTFLDISIECRL